MTLHIFAYTQCPEFQALLEVECKEISGIRPIIYRSSEDLKGMLDIFQSVEVLIVNEPEDEKSFREVRELILRSGERIKKIFVLGDKFKSLSNIHFFSRIEIADLFESLKKTFRPEVASKDVGWTAIPIIAFTHFERLPYDLFLKLSEDKYVKRIPAYEEITDALIQDFTRRGISDLYCEKKHNRDFSMMLINNMINKLEKDYECIETKLTASNAVFRTTREIIHNLGLPARVITVCEAAIERITQDVYSERNQFGTWVRNLKDQSSLEFHYRLIELTSFIGGHLIDDMNFTNKKEQIKRLVFASYFCDMTLTDPTHIHHRSVSDGEKLSLEDHNKINFHALRASELVGTYKDTPKEVSLIIRQHHGSFSGIGFPAQKSSELLPLSKIFMISQDLAYAILTDEKTEALEVLRNYVRKNQGGGFQEILAVLEGTMGKNLKESA